MTAGPALPSWCEISPAAIERNLIRALGLMPRGVRFCAVLKADAYGHGIANVMPALLRHKITDIGIVNNDEARAVRQAGFTGHLIRLRGATPAEAGEALPLAVEEQISTPAQAQAIRAFGGKAGVHLSLNAGGMSRDGLELRAPGGREMARDILELIGDRIRGICTHYPSNSAKDLAGSGAQFAQDAFWTLREGRLDPAQVLIHGGSSLTLVSDSPPDTDMLRCGAILYGILRPDLGFEPTLALKSRVTGLNLYPRRSSVGYDRAARLERDSWLAAVSVGYANGIGRHWAGRMQVLIRGQALPVLGKISMNVLTVDVTDLPEVAIGDEAVIFGTQGNARIDQTQIEAATRTIMVDLYADWGQRNARVVKAAPK